jgi:hypothetical protein
MITFHPVYIDEVLTWKNPLYVGHFFKLNGMWWAKRKQRQGLIISIATAWYRLYNQNPSAPAFVEEEVFITSLTKQVTDAKVILETFFTIKRLGFSFGVEKSATIISPKKLNERMLEAIDKIINDIKFDPGSKPTSDNLEISYVTVEPHVATSIRNRLQNEGRQDLLPPVNWILQQDGKIPFYFKPSGNLKQRDTSVWPIKAIENWPGWLRTALFGAVVDIENAFTQFIVKKLEMKYAKNTKRLEMLYPILLESVRDKKKFRESICVDILKLPIDDDTISMVKKLIMSLANGSNISGGIMSCDSSRSQAAALVKEAAPHLLHSELVEAGEKLYKIARQFKSARKDLCFYLLKKPATAANQKIIFTQYFEWERQSRYAMWEALGRTGLHLHDGLDGINVDGRTRQELLDLVADKTSISVSIDFPNEQVM